MNNAHEDNVRAHRRENAPIPWKEKKKSDDNAGRERLQTSEMGIETAIMVRW